MIITCPNCSARYRVKDELIKAKGKRVKCKKCTAVFVAYPDKDAVLEQAPAVPAAAPTPPPQKVVKPKPAPAPTPKPAAAPAPPVEAPQATVKVDRSQLDQYLKTNSMDGTQSTLKVDPDQFKQYMEKQQQETEGAQAAAGATVQVDRSQIDAFLQGNNQPSASETVQLDPSAISSLAQGGPPPEPPAPPAPKAPVEPEPAPPMPDFDATVAVPDPPPAAAPAAPVAPTPAAPAAPPIPEPAGMSAFEAPPEPSFPSDEELGINKEEDDLDFGAPPEAAPAFPDAFPESEPPAPPPPAAEAPKLYQAEVEGKNYPNLQLDSIARWVREGRLLEDDLVAPNGTQDFQRAASYPEIQPFFSEVSSQETAPPAKKKGFFARLFSFGK